MRPAARRNEHDVIALSFRASFSSARWIGKERMPISAVLSHGIKAQHKDPPQRAGMLIQDYNPNPGENIFHPGINLHFSPSLYGTAQSRIVRKLQI